MKILLPMDGSDYTKRTLAYLAAHEELLGSGHDYVVFTAVAPIPPQVVHLIQVPMIEDYFRRKAEEVFEPVRKFAEQNGWKVRLSYADGSPAQAIAKFAEAEKPDLIVMGTHGHSALGNVLLGSVANGVLARCRIPVLLVR